MGERTYRCLSIRQPWVWAIFHAGKDIENRQWQTRERGRILIHASAGMTRAEYESFREFFEEQSFGHPVATVPAMADLPHGCLFGGVTIADCVSEHASPWFFGDYGFVLADPKPLATPIPYKGHLGFFNVPASVLVALALPRGAP